MADRRGCEKTKLTMVTRQNRVIYHARVCYNLDPVKAEKVVGMSWDHTHMGKTLGHQKWFCRVHV